MSTVVVCLGASPWCRFGILQHIMSTGHVCLGASPWRRFGILQHIMSTRRIFAWGHHRYCLSLESRKTRPAPISARRAPPDDSNRFTIPYLLPLSNRCHPPFQSVPPTFFTPAVTLGGTGSVGIPCFRATWDCESLSICPVSSSLVLWGAIRPISPSFSAWIACCVRLIDSVYLST